MTLQPVTTAITLDVTINILPTSSSKHMNSSGMNAKQRVIRIALESLRVFMMIIICC